MLLLFWPATNHSRPAQFTFPIRNANLDAIRTTLHRGDEFCDRAGIQRRMQVLPCRLHHEYRRANGRKSMQRVPCGHVLERVNLGQLHALFCRPVPATAWPAAVHSVRRRVHHQHGRQRRCLDVLTVRRRQLLDGIECWGMQYLCCGLGHQHRQERRCDDVYCVCGRQVLDGIEREHVHVMSCGQILRQ